jgi:hypothetical protein
VLQKIAIGILSALLLGGCTITGREARVSNCVTGDTTACQLVAQDCDPEATATDPKYCQWDVGHLWSSCNDGNQFACNFADEMCHQGSTTVCDGVASAKRLAIAGAVLQGVGNGLNAAVTQQSMLVARIPSGYGAKSAKAANAEQLRVYCGQLAERGLAQSYYFYSAGCGR